MQQRTSPHEQRHLVTALSVPVSSTPWAAISPARLLLITRFIDNDGSTRQERIIEVVVV